MTEYDRLIELLNENVRKFSFNKKHIGSIEEVGDVENLAVWKRPSSCIVLFHLSKEFISNEDNIGKYAQKMKMKIGKEIGYLPIINEIGIQMIFYGPGVIKYKDLIPKYTDKISNLRVILQSIFIYDSQTLEYESTTTWGQFISGKYQDAINDTLKKF